MENIKIRVYYDFASTLCYVAHRVITEIEPEIAELGVELEWRPIDLTMAAPWDRGDSFAEEVRSAVRNTALTLGVDAEMPDPWIDSRPAAHVALCAKSSEVEGRWRRAVFDSIFEDGDPVLTPELIDLARELVGVESVPAEGEGSELVEECSQEAIDFGITGVPTFLLDHWMFGGVYDGDSMLSILRQLIEQYRDTGSMAVN